MSTFIPKLFLYRWIEQEKFKYLQILQNDAHNNKVLLFCICVLRHLALWSFGVYLFGGWAWLFLGCSVGAFLLFFGVFFNITDPAVDVLQ